MLLLLAPAAQRRQPEIHAVQQSLRAEKTGADLLCPCSVFSFILVQDDMDCPLCLEELDISDLNFKPCPCGYQVRLQRFATLHRDATEADTLILHRRTNVRSVVSVGITSRRTRMVSVQLVELHTTTRL